MTDEVRPLKLIISGKLQFEDQITLAQAAHILAFLDRPASGAIAGTHSQVLGKALGSQQPNGMPNPRDALEASQAKTNPEKIVALALYVVQDGSKETFTIDDIKPLFRRARETPPANMTRDLDIAVRAGWVSESETKGEFFVTAKASGVLETGFEPLRRATVSGSRSRTARGSSGAKKINKVQGEVPAVFAALNEISPTLDGYIDYHKAKRRTDKFLWAIHYAKSVNIPALTNKEITWLTDKLGDGIASGDIAACYRSNHKTGHVNRSMQDHKIRITPKGEAYLKELSQT